MALPLEYLHAARDVAATHGLSYHLDGARVWNAATALDVEVAEITGLFDSVSVCLSKGLGAPVGSVLAGGSSFISTARRMRKILGGAMRQSGILAAAGIYALDHHRTRLGADHALAAEIGEALSAIDGVDVTQVATNMVFADFTHFGVERAQELLADADVLVALSPGVSRLVTHLDAPAETAQRISNALQ